MSSGTLQMMEELVRGNPLIVQEGDAARSFLRKTLLGTEEDLEQQDGAVPIDFSDRVDTSQKDEGDKAVCERASSYLVLGFTYSEGDELGKPTDYLANMLMKREIAVQGGETATVWEKASVVGASEFMKHFQVLLGVGEESTTRRLRVSNAVREYLFRDARLWMFDAQGKAVGRLCEWEEINLVLVPHGAILVIKVDWLTEQGRFTLKDLRTWIHMSKYRNVKPGVCRGWTFVEETYPISSEAQERRILSDVIFEAVYGNEAAPLSAVANWLVHLPDEQVQDGAKERISRFNYNIHHTYAVVNKKLEDDEEWDRLLFQIRHQDGSVTRSRTGWVDGTDEVLHMRSNRTVTMCHEGMFAVEWDAGMYTEGFIRLLEGPYRLLLLQTVAEKVVLERLALLTANMSRILPQLGMLHPLEEKRNTRAKLLELGTMLATFHMSMSTDYCGGRTSYGVIFRNLRRIFGIVALKEELRGDVKDTLRIFESDYFEEKRRFDEQRHVYTVAREAAVQEKEKRLNKRNELVQVVVAVASAVIIPFNLISGLFGMNNLDLPMQTSWGWLVGGTGIVSAFLIVIFAIVYFCLKPNTADLDKVLAVDAAHEEENVELELAAQPLRSLLGSAKSISSIENDFETTRRRV